MKSIGKRLIDADVASAKAFYDPHLTDLDVKIIRKFLAEQETVDAKEVVHAFWKNGFCTNCKNEAEIQSIGFGCTPGLVRINYKNTKFCSNCGAIMDGDRNA